MPCCPKCKSEYMQGVAECIFCRTSLVDTLPEAGEELAVVKGSDLNYISVFVSDEPGEAAAVRRILSENKILFITRGEEKTDFKYVEFLVKEDLLEQAKLLLKDIIQQESVSIETGVPKIEGEEDYGGSIPNASLSQPKKALNNLYLFILLTAILGAIFVSGLERSIKYIVSGVLIVVFVLKFTYSRDKRI